MDLAFDFFKCFHDELSKEIKRALQSEVLTHHAKDRRMGYVLNKIFQESTMRYFGLLAFYASGKRNTMFQTEVSIGNSGPIDFVFSEDESRYAFELKRWQTKKEENEILEKDMENLKLFMNKTGTRTAFEIIFTVNDHSDLENPDQTYYEDSFKKTFGSQFHLLDDVKVDSFCAFTTCLYLAQPRVEG
ncbi:MAG: hypothetical protein FJ123_20760 [Deltaproteobacteria bacterium]|nr:hypothetical protein [Deltaproteobacteria bacterium]